MKKHITSESVGAGHPDKICDQIADHILDKFLEQDPNSCVAIEVLAGYNQITITGEVRSQAYVDVVKAAWEVLMKYEYTETDFNIVTSIHEQSPEINTAVTKHKKELAAGDQGIMFGYATNETKNYMPLSLELAQELLKRIESLRISNKLKWVKADMKSQVTMNYESYEKPILEKIILSIQHDQKYNKEEFFRQIKEKVISPIVKQFKLNDGFITHINQNGPFTIGVPIADTGLTGRKIIVDTYGGHARHGGGSFSGKDYSKVDRTGAYFARWIAKNVVAAKLSDRCEIQISYEYGETKINSLFIETFGTEKVEISKIYNSILKTFDFTVENIKDKFKLDKIKYLPLATYGHMGREEFAYPWEKINMVKLLKQNI